MDIFRWLFGGKLRAEPQSTARVERSLPPSGGPASRPDAIVDGHCPHCDFEIIPPPQRARNCPSCKRPIRVKRRFDEQRKRLVTPEQAEQIEAEWQAQGAQWREQRLRESLQAGESAAQQKEWADASGFYNEAAFRAFQLGMPHAPLLRKAHEYNLRHILKYHTPDVSAEVIIRSITSDRCPACLEMKGRKMKARTALKQMPIPVEGCTAFCECSYEEILEDDVMATPSPGLSP
ncbi:MAG: hypothetical protein V1724_00280 [Chloroflexota bacterium]